MAAIDFLGLLLVTLLCVISILTSAAAGLDNTYSAPSVPEANSSHVQKPSPSKIEYLHDVDRNVSKENVANTSVMAEGGPIPISSTITQHTNTKGTPVITSDILEESTARENVPKARYASPSIVARKGVLQEKEKIKPRKGVDQSSLDLKKVNISLNQTVDYKNFTPVVESSSTIEASHFNDHPEISSTNISRLIPTTSCSNANLNHSTNSNTSLAAKNITSPHIEATNNTTPRLSSHTEKHKPKPTVTSVDGAEIDEPIRSSRTKTPPSKKIDYIVPIVITTLALPLLGVAIFVLYRRGRDCWDKRHYRRMDFLIDGMYND